jgi:phosphatidylserine/phosphatidylglycerophosphate/cardiolipin synthase-like enzyme
MWQSGVISNTGNFDTADTAVGGVPVQVLFAPGRGRQIGGDIAARIETAQNRLIIASMVISSAPIMGAIVDRMHSVEKFAGIFDGSEMRMVLHEWERSRGQQRGSATAQRRAGASAAKDQEFREIAQFLHYKKSLPFKTDGVHNFMHNKFAVIDDAVVTGSFNFSTNAQSNAENVLIIESKELADRYDDYANTLIETYPDTGVPS